MSSLKNNKRSHLIKLVRKSIIYKYSKPHFEKLKALPLIFYWLFPQCSKLVITSLNVRTSQTLERAKTLERG